MTTLTIQQVIEIARAPADLEFTPSGKWLVCAQRGSKGLMDLWVSRCKEAGIPAFFSAKDRTFGVLAEKVSA